MIVSEKSGGNFPQVEAGSHALWCYGVVDIGTQDGQFGPKRQMVLLFETAEECMPSSAGEFAGQPYELMKFFGVSLHPNAKLRQELESWRKQPFTEQELKGFDMQRLLGKPCTAMVEQKLKADGTRRSVITKIGPPPKRELPQMVNEPIHVSLDPDEFDQAEFNKLGEWLRGKIEATPEYKALKGGARSVAEPADIDDGSDIPF